MDKKDRATFAYELEKFIRSFGDAADFNFETYWITLQYFHVDTVTTALRKCAGAKLNARDVRDCAIAIERERSEQKAAAHRAQPQAQPINEEMNSVAESWEQQNDKLDLMSSNTKTVGSDRIKQLRRKFEDEFCGGFEKDREPQ